MIYKILVKHFSYKRVIYLAKIIPRWLLQNFISFKSG